MSHRTTDQQGRSRASAPRRPGAREAGLGDRTRGAPPADPIKGRYRIVRPRGEGRLGAVFLCEDTTTGSLRALKLFRRELSRDEEFTRQLYRQVELAVGLCEANPRLVEVYDCGRAEDGSLFVVMEYLQGRSLRDIIQQEGPLQAERALRLAGQIAEGLGAIHAAGHVHAEVRPQNILAVREGDEETAKLKGLEAAGLTDVGLAEQMVRAGVLPATPEYVAPEQVEGDRATPRTDIYAFGAVLYEALSGVAPFTDANPDRVLVKQLQELPVALRERRPEIPPAVELKVMQALEKEPERRQRYVTDVANEYLYQLAADELFVERARQKYGSAWRQVTTVQAWIANPKGIFVDQEEGRIRRMVVAAAAGLALLAVVAAAWFLSPHEAPEQRAAPIASQPPREIPGIGRPEGASLPTGPQEPPTPAAPPPLLPEARTLGDQTVKRPEEPAPQERAKPAAGEPQAKVPTAPPPPRAVAPRAPAVTGAAQEPARRPDRMEPPAKRRAPESPPVPPPPPPSRADGPRRQPEAPDPSEIIDWLLKR